MKKEIELPTKKTLSIEDLPALVSERYQINTWLKKNAHKSKGSEYIGYNSRVKKLEAIIKNIEADKENANAIIKECNDKLNEKRSKILLTEFFPENKVIGDFFNLFHKALRHENHTKLKINLENWRKLVFETSLTMADMHFAIRILEASTCDEMQQTLVENYWMHKDIVEPMYKTWYEIDAKILKGLYEEFNPSKLIPELKTEIEYSEESNAKMIDDQSPEEK